MEDEYDLALKHLFGNFFYYKTFFIPSVILFPCLLIIEVYRNYYYIFFSIFTSLLILTWNFSVISRFIYSRPIYFEDLNKQLSLDNNEERKKIIYDIENSDKFKTRFILFQQFIISAVIALTADYIKSRFYENQDENQDEQISTFAIIGVIGGLLSLMVKVIKLLGKISLIIIYKQKKKVEENHFDTQEFYISENLNEEIIVD
jgi:hypothetical protein